MKAMVPEEYDTIIEAIWEHPWNDPGRMPALLTTAVSALGEIALLADDTEAELVATQALRRMMQRVLIGEFEYEDTHE